MLPNIFTQLQTPLPSTLEAKFLGTNQSEGSCYEVKAFSDKFRFFLTKVNVSAMMLQSET